MIYVVVIMALTLAMLQTGVIVWLAKVAVSRADAKGDATTKAAETIGTANVELVTAKDKVEDANENVLSMDEALRAQVERANSLESEIANVSTPTPGDATPGLSKLRMQDPFSSSKAGAVIDRGAGADRGNKAGH